MLARNYFRALKGDAFDAETKAAWVAVYGIVQKTMIGDNYN